MEIFAECETYKSPYNQTWYGIFDSKEDLFKAYADFQKKLSSDGFVITRCDYIPISTNLQTFELSGYKYYLEPVDAKATYKIDTNTNTNAQRSDTDRLLVLQPKSYETKYWYLFRNKFVRRHRSENTRKDYSDFN